MMDGGSLCFNRINFPLHIQGGLYGKRVVQRTWVPAPFAPCMRPSLAVLQTEGSSDKYSESSHLGSSDMGSGLPGPVLSQENTVGVIGGGSSPSTVAFLEKLVRWAMKDGGESPPFIVCSDPDLSKEFASLRARNSIPYARFRKMHNRFDCINIVESLRRKRVFLEQAGVRCLIMPCHISYAWFEEISRGCSVPFLHVGECVADELKGAKLKPLETGSNIRIGVLGTDPVMSAGIYQQHLENQGFEVIYPDEATMEHTVIPAMDTLNRKDIEGARNLLRIALQMLLVRAANTIILASEELQGLLLPDDPLLQKCIDPLDALARCVVHWARSRCL